METPTFYAVLPASVRYDSRLKAQEKILYCEITALSNVNKFCHAGNGYFSDLYGVDERTIRRWLNNLAKHGYITIEYEKQGEGQKRRIIPSDNAAADVHEMSGPDKNVRTPRTKMSDTPGQKCPQEYYKNNNTRENNTRAGGRASVSDIFRDAFPGNERLTEALLAFEESRAAGKHPLTVNAASLACNKLNQLADEAGVRDRYGYMAAVLEQSILRGWDGLFALKDDFVDAVPTQRPANTADRPREIGPDTDITDFL
ncbi:helix-turn-helix domain-containing protein [Gemmiger formicilis]|uniref:helix-turn-helix domain-containing protein n=1 Tax=Gemmiger formicilis TaxID=745368 RepID=UPI003CCB54EC